MSYVYPDEWAAERRDVSRIEVRMEVDSRGLANVLRFGSDSSRSERRSSVRGPGTRLTSISRCDKATVIALDDENKASVGVPRTEFVASVGRECVGWTSGGADHPDRWETIRGGREEDERAVDGGDGMTSLVRPAWRRQC